MQERGRRSCWAMSCPPSSMSSSAHSQEALDFPSGESSAHVPVCTRASPGRKKAAEEVAGSVFQEVNGERKGGERVPEGERERKGGERV